MENHRFVALYYWLTPLFWVADAAFGANVRVMGLEGHPTWKAAYYLFCIACGAVIWFRPRWTSLVGLTESGFNVLLTLLALVVPYYHLIDQLAAREPIIDTAPFSIPRILGLLLSGSVCVISYQLQLERLKRDARRAASRREASFGP